MKSSPWSRPEASCRDAVGVAGARGAEAERGVRQVDNETGRDDRDAPTLSQCTPAALSAGGVAVTLKTPPPGSQQGSLGSKITWKGGKRRTTTAAKFTLQKTRGTCPAGTTRILTKGSVKVVTGAAKKIIKVAEPVAATVCAFVSGPKKGQTMLAPGTKYKL